MFSLTPQQLQSFDAHVEADFVARLVSEVRKNFADQVELLPDDLVAGLVRSGIERGRSFGFEWQSSLATFVLTMFAVAPNFWRNSEVQRILRDASIPLEDRVPMLHSLLSPNVWEEIRRDYDPDGW